MRTDYETISLETPAEHVLLLTLDRPQRANAMNTQMGLDLRQVFLDLYVDTEDYRSVVVTGRGEKIFCAGGDLKDRDGMTDQQWQSQHAIFEQMVRGMREPGRLPGHGSRRGGLRGSAPLPLPRRHERQGPSGADDERAQRGCAF